MGTRRAADRFLKHAANPAIVKTVSPPWDSLSLSLALPSPPPLSPFLCLFPPLYLPLTPLHTSFTLSLCSLSTPSPLKKEISSAFSFYPPTPLYTSLSVSLSVSVSLSLSLSLVATPLCVCVRACVRACMCVAFSCSAVGTRLHACPELSEILRIQLFSSTCTCSATTAARQTL